MEKLSLLLNDKSATLYSCSNTPSVDRYVLTTTETRMICNDPFLIGVPYTEALKHGMKTGLALLKKAGITIGTEHTALVLHILRGGINFGLRDALYSAYGWTNTTSAFISSQRVFTETSGWQISENSYSKLPMPAVVDLMFGDVVATGVSLKHALMRLVNEAKERNVRIRSITFFTIGSNAAETIIAEVAAECRNHWDDFTGARVVYLEGIFGLPEHAHPLSIALKGTDLLRSPALLAPEFVESQKESLSFALERCAIYDAGSRAFDPQEYLHDVQAYWQQVLVLAEKGTTLTEYLNERFPEDARLTNSSFFAENNTIAALKAVAAAQIEKAKRN